MARDTAIKQIERSICIEDIFDDIVMSIGENLEPAEVFDEETLSDWAEANGFVKKEEAT